MIDSKIRNVLLELALALGLALASITPAGARRVPQSTAIPRVPAAFDLIVIAHVTTPRELAVAPDGDLFIGTASNSIYRVANAEYRAQAPQVFARFDDTEAAGVALSSDALFVGTEHGVWRVPYRGGQTRASAAPRRIAAVRTGGGDDHVTTSLALAAGLLYAAVGSSCNVCTESDPTRATVQQMTPDGHDVRAKAVHIRNAIALATNAATGHVWAGVAGQDELAHGHPYEMFDPISAHAGIPDYGWPTCYDDRQPVRRGIDCSHQTIARIVFPAYATPTGAAFYPTHPTGPFAFPQAYRGGAFVTFHGSWHTPLVPPRVAFVPMRGDAPLRPVDWNDPSRQSSSFVDGFARPGYGRIGRPSGIAVGPAGSLFIADDLAGVIYRVQPRAH